MDANVPTDLWHWLAALSSIVLLPVLSSVCDGSRPRQAPRADGDTCYCCAVDRDALAVW